MLLIVQDSDCRAHETPPGHPERVDRFDAVNRAVEALPQDSYKLETARPATRAELERLHAPGYIGRVEQICAEGGGALDPDTHAVPATWTAALKAAGGAIQGVEHVLAGRGRAAFNAGRPPGHHAFRAQAMGFCFFNNVALAAAAALEAHGLSRVLIVDWDVHHGNGTQALFYAEPRVFFFSMHQYPFWPGTGGAEERGAGPGSGFTLNVPLAQNLSRLEIRQRFTNALEQIAARFEPELVLISAGFDMHRADPLGGLSLESADFGEMTQELATRFLNKGSACRGLVSTLEGGYDLPALEASVAAHLQALKEIARIG